MENVANDIVNMMLKQLGATSVKTTPAKITVVKFEIGHDFRLSYLFEVHKDECTYLQRVAPYPMMLGKFYAEQDIVDYIEKDYRKFCRAYGSSKFDKYLELVNDLTMFDRKMEELFLTRRVPSEALEELDSEMKNIHATLAEITEREPLLPKEDDAKQDAKQESKTK